MSTHPQPTPPPPGGDLPQGQAHGSIPAQETRRKSWFARHKILTGVLGALVLFMFIGALGGDDEESPSAAQTTAASASSAEEGTDSSAGSPGSTADESAADEEVTAEDVTEESEAAEQEAAVEDEPVADEPAEEAAPAEPRIGEIVTVGDFAVTVNGTDGAIARIGDEYFGEEAQGQFVKVLVTVENTGASAEYFLDSEQKLVDDQDRQHSTSSSAWLLEENGLFLTEINPGNKVEGVLLYDIPADAVPTAVDLQSGFFSRSSVRVSLEG